MKTRWLFLFLLLGCRPAQREAEFVITRFAQAGRQDVFLNEKLVFKFNELLDTSSINPSNVSIRSQSGSLALGQVQIGAEGKELIFAPAPVLDAELKTGGYLPNEEYEVMISGFPRLSAVRSLSGKVLARNYRSRFRVLDPCKLPAEFVGPFEDECPSQSLSIAQRPGPVIGEPILVQFTKPIRPDLLHHETFRLSTKDNTTRIASRFELVHNQDQATVHIYPLDPVSTDKVYRLEIADSVVDFSGHSLQLGWRVEASPIFLFQFLPAANK